MKGPTWEDMENDAVRADAEYDRIREDRLLNPFKYIDDCRPKGVLKHDITNPMDRIDFNIFTAGLKRLYQLKRK